MFKRVKFNLANFRFIQSHMSTEAAKIRLGLHSMIFTLHSIFHNLCLTSWSQANHSTFKPLRSIIQTSTNTLDKTSEHFRHCAIFKKYQILSWDGVMKYANLYLMYKVIHDLVPLPLMAYMDRGTNADRITRGDCTIPLRRSAFFS